MIAMRTCLMLLMLLVTHTQALAADYVGLIDRLSGDVAAKSAAGVVFHPSAFSRLRSGDELTLVTGASVQVIYFESRKREQWQGPARFRVAVAGSEALDGRPTAAGEIRGVPSRVALASAGNVQRIGGLTLRSGPGRTPDDAAVANARADYEAWIKMADPQDILPELFIIGFLQERHDQELLRPYVETMLKKQPERAEVRALAQRLGISAPVR